MATDEVRSKQADFDRNCLQDKEWQAKSHAREKLRQEFVRKFPLNRVEHLALDEYVQGKQIRGDTNRDTFTYWVERRTTDLGRILGSAALKFGVYYSKKNHRYELTSRFGSAQEAIEFMRAEIAQLIRDGKVKNLNGIRKAKISPMFKGKILYLYYPEQYLNVFSEDHVNYFLDRARLTPNAAKLDLIGKRELLLEFKNSDSVMKDWSMYAFGRFLYREFGHPADPKKTPNPLKEYSDDFPAMDKQRIALVTFNTDVVPKQHGNKGNSKASNIDFEAQNRRNKRIGDRGEDLVFREEQYFLVKHGKAALAKDVEPTYKNYPGTGYDIKSFELDGSAKYIEVKTTTSKTPKEGEVIEFHLTETERAQAETLPNYHIYVVFDVKSENPKVWQIEAPAQLPKGHFELVPSSYHAFIKIQ
jgi:hypothetical protein